MLVRQVQEARHGHDQGSGWHLGSCRQCFLDANIRCAVRLLVRERSGIMAWRWLLVATWQLRCVPRFLPAELPALVLQSLCLGFHASASSGGDPRYYGLGIVI
jgi:hypothetical protein